MSHEAQRAHDDYRASSLELLRSVVAFGLEAIRTAVFVNGGALVAGLALMGSVYEADRALASELINAVFAFAWGVAFAGAGACLAYVAQALFQKAHASVELVWEQPYIKDEPSKSRWTFAVETVER